MAFIDIVLEPPRYGWQDKNGVGTKPTVSQILKEFFYRQNIFRTRKNWMNFIGWFWVVCLMPFFIIFFVKYFSIKLFIFGAVYGMVVMGSHGTAWYHRYGTHRAYKFKNKFWRFITQNSVVKVVPEEMYIVSHHVHHAKSDMPGDPYNANCGFWYCFLADTNHQSINKNLSEEEYTRIKTFINHTGVRPNSYKQYQKWGTIAHPARTIIHIMLNWAFWFGVFCLIGGLPLAFALFAGAFFWALGIRTFNFEGHGKGEDKRKRGTDFNWEDRSINQYWPGYVAGEWHNNHHLYPTSARSGFLPHQLDLAWYYIYFVSMLGGISSYNNDKAAFYEKYYIPYTKRNVSGNPVIKKKKFWKGLFS
jgi:fatty-acid desaturase